MGPGFSVAGQLCLDDIARAAREGYRTIVKNRPEGEEPGQLGECEIRSAAEAAGLSFYVIAFSGAPPPAAVAETALLLERVEAPVLGYCRTGRRSIMAWAMAQALAGTKTPDQLIAIATDAGYDLERMRGALQTLAPKS